jgi:hypothetical protein
LSDTNKLREALEALTRVTEEIVNTLKREAPGTPLNNHKFDGLGIDAYRAIALAREALSVPEEAGPERIGPHLEELRDLARTARKRLAFNAAYNAGRFDRVPLPSDGKDETGVTAREYIDVWEESERHVIKLCEAVAAFRSPVPEPARMSREEMVEKVMFVWQAEDTVSTRILAGQAISAVLTALGFPGADCAVCGGSGMAPYGEPGDDCQACGGLGIIRSAHADAASWQDISSAPKDGTWVLLAEFVSFIKAGLLFIGCWRQEGSDGFWEEGRYGTRVEVTHWLPLPPPPAKGDTSK